MKRFAVRYSTPFHVLLAVALVVSCLLPEMVQATASVTAPAAQGCCCCNDAGEATPTCEVVNPVNGCQCESSPAAPLPSPVPMPVGLRGEVSPQVSFAMLETVYGVTLDSGNGTTSECTAFSNHCAATTPVSLHLRINC